MLSQCIETRKTLVTELADDWCGSDGLTGLLNRRAMSEELDEVHELTRRYDNEYSIILLDIDHFKNYNDRLGHVMGDDAIRSIARLLKRSVRTSDIVYRYGGEEFLIIMPETGADSVDFVPERIRAGTEAAAIAHADSSAADVVTVSIGHTSITRHNIAALPTWTEAVEVADRALYRAKASGRNCVARSNERD